MPSKTWTDYEYTVLLPGEIRLLELDLDDGQLTGTLRCCQTEDKCPPLGKPTPPYWALSHHWDPAPKTEEQFHALPILLLHDPDHLHKRLYKLRLRNSLAEALLAIRDRAKLHRGQGKINGCNLWIDAICIDQMSNEDKEKQLGRMGDIYNGADTVIIWLGVLNQSLARGINFVRELQKLHRLEDFLKNDQYRDDWLGLVTLSRNPWFQRLWIVQEIAATKNAVLLASAEEVDWVDFESAWSIFVSQFERVRTMLAQAGFFAQVRDPFGEIKLSAANVLVDMRGLVLRKSQTGTIAEHLMTLEHLLTSLAIFEVTEPRDVVYAVLWLSSDANPEAKHKSSMRHEYQDRTPDVKRLRTQKNHSHDLGHNLRPTERESYFFPPTESMSLPLSANSNVTRRDRAGSISEPFLQVPATELEHQQADESIRKSIIITDYKQPVFELCKQVLLHIIDRTERLDIICFRWAPWSGRGEPPHPSWLLFTKRDAYKRSMPTSTSADPHFARPIKRDRANPFIGKPGSNKRPYLACGRTRATAKHVQIDGRVLRVMGWRLGEIEDDAGEALHAVIPWKWRRVLGWTRNEEIPPEQFWRTLVADKGPDDQPPPIRFRLACKWAFELGAPTDIIESDEDEISKEDGHDLDLNLKEIRNDGSTQDVLKEFLDCAIATVWKRKLFKTKTCPHAVLGMSDSCFFGLGPNALRKGDIVAVLWGCAVPVILRPKKRAVKSTQATPSINVSAPPNGLSSAADSVSGDSMKKRTFQGLVKIRTEPIVEDFEFVGECYVHGMMNGEIFHWADSHGKTVMDFNLH